MTHEEDNILNIEVMSAVDLIKALDRIYPERCISPLDTLESAHRYAGRRSLVVELLGLLDEPTYQG